MSLAAVRERSLIHSATIVLNPHDQFFVLTLNFDLDRRTVFRGLGRVMEIDDTALWNIGQTRKSPRRALCAIAGLRYFWLAASD